LHSIAKNHAIENGNKRLGWLTTAASSSWTGGAVTQGEQLEQLAEAAIDMVTTELRRALRTKAEKRLAERRAT
jgi:prophage maintenance system killer protein